MMKIKLVHAHFLISMGDYSNEPVGLTAELEDGDTVQSAVAEMREQVGSEISKKTISTMTGFMRGLI